MKLEDLYKIIRERKASMPEGSYTSELFQSGLDRIIQKVGEEAVEVAIASKNADKVRMIEEVSDLIYHLLVLMNEKDININDLEVELEKRHLKSSK